MKRLLALLALWPGLALSAPESHYQDAWCAEWGGETEVRLYNATRVDCLLPDFAVEVDFGHKWAESIGQALLYGNLTNRTPAVLLIIKPGDERFLARWHNAADGLGIRLFVIGE